MAMPEERDGLICKHKVLVGISLGKNVVVLVGQRAVNELCLRRNLEGSYRKARKILSVRIRQHRASPVNRVTGMRVELRGLVQTCGKAIMVTANRDCIKGPDTVDGFDVAWAM